LRLRGVVSSAGVEDIVPSRPPAEVAVTVYWGFLIDQREEVERRTGRNKALPERIYMMEVWMEVWI